MKKSILFLIWTTGILLIQAQDITGDWYGKIAVMNKELRLNFHIKEKAGVYTASMDSPDQNVYDIPAESVSYQNGELVLRVGNIHYKASLRQDSLIGTFKQSVIKTELNMSHTPLAALVKTENVHPQTPKVPFPYSTEEVQFQGGGDYLLAGTLSTPARMKKNSPIVVFVSGSGPQDRDENIFNHQPFWVIADAFARQGIASLRYDDRGTAKSQGSFIDGDSRDNLKDAQAAVAFLKSRGYTCIGAMGHSEGGMIVAGLSAQDPAIAFIISLAGTGLRGSEVLQKQAGEIHAATQAHPSAVELYKYTADILNTMAKENVTTSQEVKEIVSRIANDIPENIIRDIDMNRTDYTELLKTQLSDPWMLYFIVYDPSDVWAKVQCPVLALNGLKDLQVNAEANLEAIHHAIAGKVKLETHTYAGLNHLFQHCQNGTPDEYESIEETFSPEVIEDMVNFIKRNK